jgi:hypothetical protein
MKQGEGIMNITLRASSIPLAVAAAGLVLAFGTACSSGSGTGTGTGSAPASPPSTAALPQAEEPVELDPADFSTVIDNTYWPMTPGTRWTYRETDGDGGELRVVVTVTSETKQIANGIEARVVRDSVFDGDQLVEDTFDWYAQDSAGTIWYLGEDTTEYENGKVSTGGSFEAGVDGALPGVAMPGDPSAGLAYRQEYLKGEAEDNGKVLSTEEMADVPAGHYDNALLTKDTSTIEPDVLEYKLYAPEVGPVLTLAVSGGAGREELLEVAAVSDAEAAAAGTTPLGEPYE